MPAMHSASGLKGRGVCLPAPHRRPTVYLLKPGSIERDELGRILDARSSVVLITSGPHRIVVDTGLAGEESTIVSALAELGLRPEEVDIIVNTHSHPDHCGGNHLFREASKAGTGDGEIIAPGVSIMATAGHSPDSISVVVDGSIVCLNLQHGAAGAGPSYPDQRTEAGIIVIAGDALPTLGNFLKEVPPALHTDRNLAEASLKKIIEIADVVVPGHDTPFSIRKKAYIPNSGKMDLTF